MTRAGRDHHLPPSDRMVAFTDAAVAIALTLLVLPLVDIVPDAARSGEDALTLIAQNLAPIGSFLLSFVVIARFWISHHTLFSYDHRLTRGLVQLNLLWVLTIAILPFPTEMIATFATRGYVVALYLVVLLACSACLSVMTIMMRRTGVGDETGDRVPEELVVGSLGSTTTMAVALAVELAFPALGPSALFVLVADPVFTPIIRRLRGGSSPRRARKDGADQH